MRLFIICLVIAIAGSACNKRLQEPKCGVVRSINVLTSYCTLAEPDFTRKRILQEFQRFRLVARSHHYRLFSMAIGRNESELMEFAGGWPMAGGAARAPAYYQGLSAAYLVGCEKRVSVRLKLGRKLEVMQLEGESPADEVHVGSNTCRLVSIRLWGSGAVRDFITFYVTCRELGTQGEADQLLKDFMQRAGTASGELAVRTDSFFAIGGGPVVDVFQSPTAVFSEAHMIAPFYDCTAGLAGRRDGCVLTNNYHPEVPRPPGPPGEAM